MIPQIIHYCWFGRQPLPALAVKCINSWRKFLPNYEIKEWNEDNFDVNLISYTKDAYNAKKYAFVSDFARLWILYNFGGLYFDTDVEVIKNLDDIIQSGPFMGCESRSDPFKSPMDLGVAPGLGLGAEAGDLMIKQLLDMYSILNFYNPDGTMNIKTTIVSYTTTLLCKYGLRNVDSIQQCGNYKIYPKEYFCPIDYVTLKKEITNNTRTIHHYAATWQLSKKQIIIEKYFGFSLLRIAQKIYKFYKR